VVVVGGTAWMVYEALGHERRKHALVNFTALNDERRQLIRWGACQFSDRNTGSSIASFIKNWKCSGDEENLTRLPLLIVGDSHSADKVMSIRLNGYDVAAMGGAACSLMPSKMSDTCREQFDHVKSWVSEQKGSISTIGLSERFKEDELNSLSFREMIEYWSVPGKRLIIFTKMPRFKSLKGIIEATTRTGVPLNAVKVEAYLEDAKESEKVALEMAARYCHVSVVNTKSLFCSLSDNCGWKRDGKSLLVDGHHLSRFGAQLLGEKLVPELMRILENEKCRYD
jgi:hypothetical protein